MGLEIPSYYVCPTNIGQGESKFIKRLIGEGSEIPESSQQCPTVAEMVDFCWTSMYLTGKGSGKSKLLCPTNIGQGQ